MTDVVVYVMGYEIRATPKRLAFDPPSNVGLHRLGGEAPTYFTPEEACRFGEATAAAEKAQ